MLPLTLLLLTAAPHPVVIPQPALVDLKPEFGAYVSESLSVALTRRGLRVITSAEIQTLLGVERQKALLGCELDSSCLTEISAALGADRVLQVSIARLPKSLRLTARLIGGDNTVLASEERRADSEDELLDLVPGLADSIADVISPRPRRARWPWLTTGALGIASAAVAGVGLGVALSNNAQLTGPGAPLSFAEGQRLAAEGATWQWVSRVGFGLAGALLVSSVVLALVGPMETPAPHVNVVVMPGGAGLAVGGAF